MIKWCIRLQANRVENFPTVLVAQNRTPMAHFFTTVEKYTGGKFGQLIVQQDWGCWLIKAHKHRSNVVFIHDWFIV